MPAVEISGEQRAEESVEIVEEVLHADGKGHHKIT